MDYSCLVIGSLAVSNCYVKPPESRPGGAEAGGTHSSEGLAGVLMGASGRKSVLTDCHHREIIASEKK